MSTQAEHDREQDIITRHWERTHPPKRGQQTRDKLVRELTPHEAGALLVHSHSISPERRDALLFLRGPAEAYFTPKRQAEIKEWIRIETHLATDDRTYDHPKLATHWCDYCGHIASCEHDHPKREPRKQRQAHTGQITLEQSEATRLLIALSKARDVLASLHEVDRILDHCVISAGLTEVQSALWELAHRINGDTKAKEVRHD